MAEHLFTPRKFPGIASRGTLSARSTEDNEKHHSVNVIPQMTISNTGAWVAAGSIRPPLRAVLNEPAVPRPSAQYPGLFVPPSGWYRGCRWNGEEFEVLLRPRHALRPTSSAHKLGLDHVASKLPPHAHILSSPQYRISDNAVNSHHANMRVTSQSQAPLAPYPQNFHHVGGKHTMPARHVAEYQPIAAAKGPLALPEHGRMATRPQYDPLPGLVELGLQQEQHHSVPTFARRIYNDKQLTTVMIGSPVTPDDNIRESAKRKRNLVDSDFGTQAAPIYGFQQGVQPGIGKSIYPISSILNTDDPTEAAQTPSKKKHKSAGNAVGKSCPSPAPSSCVGAGETTEIEKGREGWKVDEEIAILELASRPDYGKMSCKERVEVHEKWRRDHNLQGSRNWNSIRQHLRRLKELQATGVGLKQCHMLDRPEARDAPPCTVREAI